MDDELPVTTGARTSSRGIPRAVALSGIITFVLLASAAYAAVGAGTSSAATVNVSVGSDWFCDSRPLLSPSLD